MVRKTPLRGKILGKIRNDFKNEAETRLTRGQSDGNLLRHLERRELCERRGNLENDTEKRSEQRQLILREESGKLSEAWKELRSRIERFTNGVREGLEDSRPEGLNTRV